MILDKPPAPTNVLDKLVVCSQKKFGRRPQTNFS